MASFEMAEIQRRRQGWRKATNLTANFALAVIVSAVAIDLLEGPDRLRDLFLVAGLGGGVVFGGVGLAIEAYHVEKLHKYYE